MYEGCLKWIAYFYLETSNFKLAQKYSFHALEVLPVARNAKFQLTYPLLEGVTVRWFGHWWMADPSACRDWYFRPARNAFNFRNKKKSHGARSGEYRGVRQNSYFFFLQKRCNYCGSTSTKWVQKNQRAQYMTRSSFWMIKYMNGSVFFQRPGGLLVGIHPATRSVQCTPA